MIWPQAVIGTDESVLENELKAVDALMVTRTFRNTGCTVMAGIAMFLSALDAAGISGQSLAVNGAAMSAP
jgi:hypothetical protein